MRPIIRGTAGKKGRERGGILVIAVIVILAMLIMAIPFLFKLSGQWRSTERSSHSLAAFNLAEAGVEKVVWNINLDFTSTYDPLQDDERINWDFAGTSGTIDNIKASDNSVSGDVTLSLAADPDPGGMTPGVTRPLESTGLVSFIADRAVDRTVRVILERYFDSIFDYGFVVDQYFRITNTQLTVDSYDSRVANYDSSNPGDFGFFAINNQNPDSFVVDQGGGGTIDVTGGIAAGGDAITDGDPDTIPSDALADSIVDLPKQIDSEIAQIPMEEPFALPPVNLKTLHPKATWPAAQDISNWFTDAYIDGTQLPAWSEVNYGFKGASENIGKTLSVTGSTTLDASANGVYTSLVLGDGASLAVAPNENVIIMVSEFAGSPDVAHFVMGRAANIVIGEGATLTLILGRTSFYMGHQSAINVPLTGTTDQPGTPGDCIILGTNAFTPDSPLTGDLPKKEGRDIQEDHTLSPVGTIVFEQQVDIAAAMYTPVAQAFDILGMNHADIYGAWIANSMIFKVAAGFHYDKALGDIMIIDGGPPKWKVVNWQEKVGN